MTLEERASLAAAIERECEREDADFVPKYSKQQVDNCSFDAWYESFKHVAIKSEIIALPPAFIQLLLADQIIVPDKPHHNDEHEHETTCSVNQTRELIEKAIAKLKGRVFVKTNWSCPQDAMWMLGSLQCTSFDDVFMLLKSSDFIVHDLTQPYSGATLDESDADHPSTDLTCSKPRLVLKKYCNFYDSMHFRCFVRNHRLIGVCQRKIHEFYEFLQSQQEFLCELILNFFQLHFRLPTHDDDNDDDGSSSSTTCRSKFPDPDYIFDVYVDQQHKVHLLDINVFGELTDPLLFTWHELTTMDQIDGCNDLVDFRVVESPQKIQANPLSSYRTPTDFVDHLVGASGMEEFLEQVKRDNTRGTGDSDDSDSDNATDEMEHQEDDEDDDDEADWSD